jgi:hypothetical protein
LQPIENLLRRQRTKSDSGQLDSQRDAFQPANKLRDGQRIRLAHREVGQNSARSCGKQPGSFGAKQTLRGGRIADVRQGHGRHGDNELPGNTERLAAGCQDADAGAGMQDRLGQHGARIEQMLAIVQQEQYLAPGEPIGQHRGRPHCHTV